MNKIVFIVFAFALTFSSCKKKDPPCTSQAGTTTAPASEEQMVTDYLTANSITAVELGTSGLYYSISAQGSDERADQCSILRVKYVGKFTNGTIFDQTQGDNVATFELGGLIEGWKRTLTLIGEGGKIKLYIPPSLGYGSTDRVNPQTGQIVIPKNSVLVFEIDLVTITK